MLLSALVSLAFLCLTGAANDGPLPPTFEYLFTIEYAFGGASGIIRSPVDTINANTFVGASIYGPALNGHISRGVITNKFVPFEETAIVFEEATWFGWYDNGGKNGTILASSVGLVDKDLYEQQRVQLTLDEGPSAWLQYVNILCGSLEFSLRTASAKQDCYRTTMGNKVVLPPIFGGGPPAGGGGH